jgi:hypothetical protein
LIIIYGVWFASVVLFITRHTSATQADGRPIRQVLHGQDEWLDNEFVEVVQQRGAAVIKVGCFLLDA